MSTNTGEGQSHQQGRSRASLYKAFCQRSRSTLPLERARLDPLYPSRGHAENAWGNASHHKSLNRFRLAFDLHRFDLYGALHWPLPERWREEKPTPPDQPDTQGQVLSQFLHRGLGVADIKYEHDQKEKRTKDGEKET